MGGKPCRKKPEGRFVLKPLSTPPLGVQSNAPVTRRYFSYVLGLPRYHASRTWSLNPRNSESPRGIRRSPSRGVVGVPLSVTVGCARVLGILVVLLGVHEDQDVGRSGISQAWVQTDWYSPRIFAGSLE